MDVAAAAERRAGRRVAEVVEQLAPPAAVAGGGVVLDRAVGLPAAVGRGAAELGDAGAIECCPVVADPHAAAGAGRERERARPLGDREQDPVAVLAGVDLAVPARDQRGDLLDASPRPRG